MSVSNPWTKKNPYMSMWLSAANRAAGSARGRATSAVKQQVATTQADLARQVLDFWSAKPAPRKKSSR